MNREELHKKIRQMVQQLVEEKRYVSPSDLLLKIDQATNPNRKP